VERENGKSGEHPNYWMKLLDWYIAKKFLTTFVVTIFLFVIIIIVFDIAEKLDDFLEHNAPVKGIIFTYYSNFIPSMINTFSPIFVFIAVLYFTSRLAGRSEFISMLAGGMSLKRILLPYFLVGGVIAYSSYLLNAWIIPRSDKKRVRFENMYLRDYWSQAKGTLYRQLRPGVILYMEYFNNNDSSGVGINIEHYEGTRLKSNTFGKFLRWNKEKGTWRMENVLTREFKSNGNQIVQRKQYLDTAIPFDPRDFFFKIEDVQSLNMTELRSFIAKEELRGSGNIQSLKTELHRRYGAPFSTFILITIAVCVAGRKTRGGLGFSMAIGIFVIIFYLFFSKYFMSLGQSGVMPPWLAVWALNLLFIPVAWVFYKFAQK
jgi:lipopolysaccharide export system permease protein